LKLFLQKVYRLTIKLSLYLFIASPLLYAQSAAFFYDGIPARSEGYKTARYISRLTEHFPIQVTGTFPVSAYQAGMLEAQDYIFLIFEEGAASAPDNLLQDLTNTSAVVVWIHSHIDGLLEKAPEKWDIQFLRGEERNDWSIVYKDTDFKKEDPWLNIIKTGDKPETFVPAWVKDEEDHKYPYVVQSRNLWYFADSPFSYALEGGRFLILADLLHEIFDSKLKPNRDALVRIEDINPASDPSQLKKVAKYLHGEKVPFQISIVPIFKDPSIQLELTLSERPELVKALLYAQARGGSIVMHGVTHQNLGVTGDDYEFWDDIAGQPIPHETVDWADQKIKRGISIFAENGLYPLAWETPHYSGSQENYRTISQYFSTFNDRIMAAELSGTQQIFPYPVKLSDPNILVIPENLGYIDLENPDPDRLIDNARNMLVVRDGMASFFFHPFVSIKHLKKVVKSMKKQGWRFISIRDFECRLETDALKVKTNGNKNQIRLDNQYLHERLIDRKGRIAEDFYSDSRQTGIVTRNISQAPRSIFVLEALDLLPEKDNRSRGQKILTKVRGWFQSKKIGPDLKITRAAILTTNSNIPAESNNQQSFISVLEYFGIKPDQISRKDLSISILKKYNLLVIPFAAALDLPRNRLNAVLDFVAQGGNLITDGKTPLAEAVGIQFKSTIVPVHEVQDLSLPVRNLHWDPAVPINVFTSQNALILAKDAWSDTALAVIQPFRRGKVLFFGACFDPIAAYGYSRFPYFPQYLRNGLGLSFHIRRNSLEFYFDPGLRQDASWERLVKSWKASGVKIIYLATWHFYRSYAFDYEYFIKLCHDSGIAVYAWFEFPQVTPLFWEENPLWREKTATGRDARPHWRMLMNLYNPGARQAVKAWMREFLLEHDWDGVNLAEFNFDTNQGRKDPGQFTPMNQDIRTEYKNKQGIDPLEFFTPSSAYYWPNQGKAFEDFLQFRADIVKSMHEEFLEEIYAVISAKQKNMEVIVTAMDSLLHPEIFEDCGIDTLDIIELMDSFPFTLQIEDPARSWTAPPSRYTDYLETYKKHISDLSRLMFDVNIIPNREITGYAIPSALATGVELAALVSHAAAASGRVGIYSEFTVHPFDMEILPYVMGSDVQIEEQDNGYLFKAEAPFILAVTDPNVIPLVNGEKWPFYGTAGICLPSGSNLLRFEKPPRMSAQNLTAKILMEGDIKSLQSTGYEYKVRYQSLIPVPLTFSRPLEKIELDSREVELSNQDLGMILPRGEHELRLVTSSASFQAIGEAGYYSASIFYLLGLFSVLLLGAFYIYARVKR